MCSTEPLQLSRDLWGYLNLGLTGRKKLAFNNVPQGNGYTSQSCPCKTVLPLHLNEHACTCIGTKTAGCRLSSTRRAHFNERARTRIGTKPACCRLSSARMRLRAERILMNARARTLEPKRRVAV